MTELDPTTALVVIDLQDGVVALPTAHPVEGIIAGSRTLADAFKRQGMPVVLVNVNGFPPGRTDRGARRTGSPPEGWSDLVPGLGHRSSDHTITKQTPGAFTGTGLDGLLRDLGVTQIVLTGISTSVGVEMTARQAFEAGYHVTLAVDAITDTDLDSHQHTIARVFPRIGETGTIRDILNLLESRQP